MPLDRARIREFLDQDEGDPPPVFVGHDAILDDILDTATRKAGRPKVTRAVQGAPGAGKSSLLHEMQQRWTGQDGTPRVVTVSSAAVSRDTPGVIQAIMAAGISPQDGWRRILRERIGGLKSVGASVAGYGLTAEFAVYGQADLLSAALRQGRERAWNRAVVVAVDEAQALEGDPHSVAACFLREIHNADTRLPLLLVLAGLSDTADRARGMQLTRNVTVLETEPLSTAEARGFMRRLALWFGLDTSRHNARLDDLADICDGWPRHLRHAGVALAEEALRVDGDMDLMDWTHVGQETLRRRQKYYRDQCSTSVRETIKLVAAVMKDIPGPEDRKAASIDRVCILDLIDLHRDRDGSRSNGWRLPEGMTSRKFLDVLIHQGALYENGDGYIHSPIPSFRSYLIERGTETDHRPTADSEDVPDADTNPSP